MNCRFSSTSVCGSPRTSRRPDAAHLPLLVLVTRVRGKSLLTKVLAARLPHVTFTAVRVPLRHVPAGADLLQVQEALNQAPMGASPGMP